MAINKTSKKERKSSGKYSKTFGILGAIFIIALLVISGPAQAFVLDLTSDKSSVSKGETVVFNASVDINSNENLPISKLVLELNGPETVSCEFNVDGTIISGCKGITIKKISGGNYLGYGYGYGEYHGYGYDFGYGYGYNGKLEYEITLASDNYQTGIYSTALRVYIENSNNNQMLLKTSENEIFSKTGGSLTITASDSSPNYNSGNVRRICLNNGWICSEWSSCIDGKQTRICSEQPNCYLENKPEEQRACVIALKVNSSLINNGYDNLAGTLNLNNDSNDENSDSNDKEENMGTFGLMQNFLAGITGAVTGTSGKNQLELWIAVMFLAVLAGIVLGLFLVKSIRRARKIRKIRELNRIRYRPPKN